MAAFVHKTQKRIKTGQDYSSIGNLLALWDPNDSTNFYQNTETVTKPFDSSPRNVLWDSNTLTLSTNALGDNAAFTVASAQRASSAVGFDFLATVTYFMVAKLTDTTVARAPFGNLNQRIRFQATSGDLEMTGDGSTYQLVGAATPNQPHIFVCSFSPGATSFGTIDGVSSGMFDCGSGSGTGNTYLGINYGLADQFLGDIYLFGAYSGTLTTTRRKTLEQMLSARFQISVTP